eukprot:TRINITY_DN16393_c0_g1_i2.p1 TRINITY_DN16393_c0_g1~~TRINITY_DN16393_c0_g1_i2.p1  ORF type:complete len:184 (-),score=32.52 TRINITY_DN16393_c0_g1_i2:100-612(-)
MGAPAFRGPSVNPPLKGAFPIDHFKLCTPFFKAYLRCLQLNDFTPALCTKEARAYLKCRMDHGLMDEEDLEKLVPDSTAPKRTTSKFQESGFVSGVPEAELRMELKEKKREERAERRKRGSWWQCVTVCILQQSRIQELSVTHRFRGGPLDFVRHLSARRSCERSATRAP